MKKQAFTLAEVLITLTIIGVIAALTIPNLMQKWQDQQAVSGVKEAYSILNNAFALAIKENGDFNDWGWPDNTTRGWSSRNSYHFINIITPYLKVYKNCQGSVNCIPNDPYSKYKDFTGVVLYNGMYADNRIILSNGMIVGVRMLVPGGMFYDFEKGRGELKVDINGAKGPNQYGYDVFYFNIEQTGIRPKPFPVTDCNKNGTGNNGYGCTTWVLYKGNLDYKYRDITKEK